jgi:hypothetical protein
MQPYTPKHVGLDPNTQSFYCQALTVLCEADIPFLVGGAYALAYYTGIVRHTKDFDIFVRPADFLRVLDVCSAAGYPTEITFPSWLGKVLWESDTIDVIFSSGNGVARVDEGWFAHAATGEILGMPLRICPVEEIIWSKASIMGRERYDGADIAHLLHAQGQSLDWQRLLSRFGSDWRVLFSHLILFGYIYPTERAQIPDWVMHELVSRLQREMHRPGPTERVCQGTVLSWDQYLVDVEQERYHDSRLIPRGMLTAQDIAHITAILKGTKRPLARPPASAPARPGAGASAARTR